MENPFNKFKKITPVNGLDATNPDNAMQNNYAWSMTELGDYIYVGTARNIPYSIFVGLAEIPIPKELTPKNPVMRGEIWRYRKDGTEGWQQVYQTPENLINLGFRFMITYKDAIYAGALTPYTPNLFMLKYTEGGEWELLENDIIGYSTRYMVEHNGKLYMGALPLMGEAGIQLFVSEDPKKDGWQLVDVNGDPDKNPRGNVDLLLSYNNHLYVGTALHTGFEVWRTIGEEPEKDQWQLVVDKGAGDARNEHPWSWAVFNDYIYLGSAIEAGVLSINPDQRIVPPKGFDVIRIDKNDHWELVVGGDPVVPTEPTTGTRGQALSGFSSGFGNVSNAYCWQIQPQGHELYLGTFSWSVLIPTFIPLLPELLGNSVFLTNPILSRIPIEQLLGRVADLLERLGCPVLGFDLWKSKDGAHWVPVSLNGLGNPHNYGVRMLFLDQDENLYLGTANPYDGLEVWLKSK